MRQRLQLISNKIKAGEINYGTTLTKRGKTGRSEDIQLLYDINEQPLKISEMDVEIEQYWDSIYKKTLK